ncbi:hypothetical protein HUT16_04135 [Kitasatospora sp. NA04385]|uniref:hypothetical protein n=1 Tax=Kitasatospora sp. NA04385 TaxID=2742135 RepID=UPI0015929ABD|nr:hypothetical protein [Kitasatospora sp. NA04385]QKW18360.1 hypothetical protein HUT16_04135 [Kitasatospora sp. NA04385]
MPTDHELTAALALALDDAAELAPTTTDGRLAAAARRSGRRRRHRQYALTGAAAVLALGATGTIVGNLPSDSTGPTPVRAADSVPPTGQPKFTRANVSLPYNGTQPESGQMNPLRRSWLSESYSISLLDGYTTDGLEELVCPDPGTMYEETCERSVQPDGSVVLVRRGLPYDPEKQAAAEGYMVQGVRVFPNGHQVELFQSYRDKAAEPVVTEDEFVAESGQVDFPQLDALPTDAPTGSGARG